MTHLSPSQKSSNEESAKSSSCADHSPRPIAAPFKDRPAADHVQAAQLRRELRVVEALPSRKAELSHLEPHKCNGTL